MTFAQTRSWLTSQTTLPTAQDWLLDPAQDQALIQRLNDALLQTLSWARSLPSPPAEDLGDQLRQSLAPIAASHPDTPLHTSPEAAQTVAQFFCFNLARPELYDYLLWHDSFLPDDRTWDHPSSLDRPRPY